MRMLLIFLVFVSFLSCHSEKSLDSDKEATQIPTEAFEGVFTEKEKVDLINVVNVELINDNVLEILRISEQEVEIMTGEDRGPFDGEGKIYELRKSKSGAWVIFDIVNWEK